ncbi:hypothetical protein JANAI62_26050 [Jannaschia pagri]|uniref:DUF2852 domain-containing protein n=1 Tax=Jannaschia pagri TaxID=2829797 RepID=A0ABQ4NPG9_9RHOB|nr:MULTISPECIES: DUF2852 domain-containing protein [unclassified Jannaschia]GIT92147.1 hypothetical protein JANAI61_26050 [Jannaschia sp. AI_61]GIT95982.1 hypothetical protein JANAI62_26050 [Jannaschia sp. AI_62]
MTPSTAYAGQTTSGNWLTRTEAWLDARGKGAWIAAMVLGFVFFWPVGLALLAYMIWSKRMFSDRKTSMTCSSRRTAKMNRMRSSGNAAFDAYKADMLRRLEEEQEAFQDYLQRLREAKDKAEFDQFMEERAKRGGDSDATVEA